MQEYGEGVIRVDRLADAVCYWLDLRFKGLEQAIPNDERTRVVACPNTVGSSREIPCGERGC